MRKTDLKQEISKKPSQNDIGRLKQFLARLIPASEASQFRLPFNPKEGYFENKLRLGLEYDVRFEGEPVKSIRTICLNDDYEVQADQVYEIHLACGRKVLCQLVWDSQSSSLLSFQELLFLTNAMLYKKYFTTESGSPGEHLEKYMSEAFKNDSILHKTAANPNAKRMLIDVCEKIEQVVQGENIQAIKNDLDNLYNFLIQKKFFFELIYEFADNNYSFSRVKNVMVIPWWKKSVDQEYRKNERQFYSNLAHPNIAGLINKYINGSSMIVSMGCGDALDLKACHKEIGNAATYLGVDINEENINAAKQNLIHVENKGFIQGDITQMSKDDIHKHLKSHAKTIVFIYCGVLARQVMKGSYTGVMQLQKIIDIANIIVMTSYSPCIVDRRMIKAIGFQRIEQISQRSHKNHEPVFVIKPQSSLQRLEYLIKRSERRSKINKNIDLSMSAKPIADLDMVKKKNTGMYLDCQQIDLSWSWIDEELQITTLIQNHLTNMKGLKFILLSGYEPWAEKFVKEISQCKSITTAIRYRQDNAGLPSEVALFSRQSLLCFKEQAKNKEAEDLLSVTNKMPMMKKQ